MIGAAAPVLLLVELGDLLLQRLFRGVGAVGDAGLVQCSLQRLDLRIGSRSLQGFDLLDQVGLFLLQVDYLLDFAVAFALQAGDSGIDRFQNLEQAACGFAKFALRALQVLLGERVDDHADGPKLGDQTIELDTIWTFDKSHTSRYLNY
ncbi:hypothetical protein D3C76_1290270 [compost metagenome]